MTTTTGRTVWESIDAVVCAVALLLLARWKLLDGVEAAHLIVMISIGRSGLLAANKLLGIIRGGGDPPTAPPAAGSPLLSAPPIAQPPPLPTSPLALVYATVSAMAQRPTRFAVSTARALAAALVVVCVAGCGGLFGSASSPSSTTLSRAIARAIVHGSAWGVEEGAKACALLGPSESSAKCARAIKAARASLHAASTLVDAWEAGAKAQWMCVVLESADAGLDVVDALHEAGAPIPHAVLDWVELARMAERYGERAMSCPVMAPAEGT